jgi:hypothetical protein
VRTTRRVLVARSALWRPKARCVSQLTHHTIHHPRLLEGTQPPPTAVVGDIRTYVFGKDQYG